MTLKALPTNILVNHPAYPKIIMQYGERLKADGKVNSKKFYEEVIKPEIPDYHIQSWYYFLKRFKTSAGLIVPEVVNAVGPGNGSAASAESATVAILLSNDEATRKLVQTTLNISAQAAQDIIDDPNNVSSDTLKRLELGFKAMKAQDSRIHALGKIREDKREQDKFDRAFQEASFQ